MIEYRDGETLAEWQDRDIEARMYAEMQQRDDLIERVVEKLLPHPDEASETKS